jgi:hypothetical protein
LGWQGLRPDQANEPNARRSLEAAIKHQLSGPEIAYPVRAGVLCMSLVQFFSIVFLAATTFTFGSYLLINNLLMEWNDEF